MKAIFNENEKSQDFELIRYEDNHGWLYGRIFNGDDFICDTVEVSGLEVAGNETYQLQNIFEPYNANPPICLVDHLGKKVCEFVDKNTVVDKNIEMRVASRDICVGARLHYANLVSCEFSLQKLKRLYRSLSAVEDNVYLKITEKYTKHVVKHNLKGSKI
jgi:hypothetical protein